MENFITLIDSYTPPQFISPAISVIIPLYNTEKYIGECLESILNQSFQNFEVIVVDDCSTDSSCEVVEGYIPRFADRLSLYHMIKHSGNPGEPRNDGFLLSRGEYVFFLDADDVLTQNALGEMYNLAKEYDADVVYCEKYFISSGVGQEFKDNIHLADSKIQNSPFVDKPTFEVKDLNERIKKCSQGNPWRFPTLRLVRKDLIINNEIKFPSCIGSADDIWSLEIFLCSQRFLRVPNAYYIRRMHDESASFRPHTPAKWLHKWMDRSIRSLKDMDNFLGGIKFFRDKPKCRHDILNYFLSADLSNSFKECQDLSRLDVYNAFRQNFGKYLGEYEILISCFVALTYDFDKNLRKTKQNLKNAEEDAQKLKERIAELEDEIKRLTTENSYLKKENDDLMKTQSSFQFVSDDLNALPSLFEFDYVDLMSTPSRSPLAQNDSMPTLSPSPLQITKPAISVVIPMYNSEEYISECLDSLLIQTFQDFEVIVVDDCSTDKSVEIVNSYVPKFNGRLYLTSTKENSGGGGYIPRNLGFKLANGEYIFFLDADDFLLNTAFEIFYNAAKKYNTDVIYTPIYYHLNDSHKMWITTDFEGAILRNTQVEDKPALIVDNSDKILNDVLIKNQIRAPWVRFIRRDFLIDNEIIFPEIRSGGDNLWTMLVCAHSKRFLRLPKPLYFHVKHSRSIMRVEKSPEDKISEWALRFVLWLKEFYNIKNKIEFMRENPNICYETINGYFYICFNNLKQNLDKIHSQDIHEVLYREFVTRKDSSDWMIPILFSFGYAQYMLLDRLRKHTAAIVDVKLMSTTGNFQILSVSDNKANITKPNGLNKGGIGYTIKSYAGDIELTLKATVKGQINLDLKGMNIRNPEDKYKHIPYWIDYTKLTVNGQNVFDTLTPVWHDKPYHYTMNVKANEEINVKFQWIPRRDDFFEFVKTIIFEL